MFPNVNDWGMRTAGNGNVRENGNGLVNGKRIIPFRGSFANGDNVSYPYLRRSRRWIIKQ